MKDAHLEFNEKPKYHVIVVLGGEKSEPFHTKVQAFKKITDLANKLEVSPGDFAKMRDEIFQEDNLPWEIEEPERSGKVTIEISSPFGFQFGNDNEFPFDFLGLGSMFGNPFMSSRNPISELEMLSMVLQTITASEIEEPTFIPCNLCKGDDRHGKILAKGFMSEDLPSRKEAVDALAEALERKLLTEEQGKKVHEQIDACWPNAE